MKSLLPLALASLLASCTSPRDYTRPSAEIPNQGAPRTNRVLDVYAAGAGLHSKIDQDVAHDTIDYGGRVADRQARNYTKIGLNAVRRSDDLAHREASRYTNYALDTYDDVADQEVRTARRWFKFGSKSAKRAFQSTEKMYQNTMIAYGDAVERTYFSAWKIITPPEPKPYMVGSLNDRVRATRVPGGIWTKDFSPPVQYIEVETSTTSAKNPVYVQAN